MSAVTLLNGSTVSYSYDANGNMTEGHNGLEVSYDALNKPVRTQRNNMSAAGWADFAYSPNGVRYSQRGTKRVDYVGKYYERIDGNVHKVYLGDYAVLTRSAGGTELRYLHRDRLGSVVTSSDEAGVVALAPGEARHFDPFGKPQEGDLQDSDDPLKDLNAESVTSRGFTAHEHLNSVQLIHMNGRAYDYQLGRFLSVDPFIQFPANGQSVNPYSYIMNNPMAGTDPSGYSCVSDGDSPVECDKTPRRTERDWVGKGDRRSLNNKINQTGASSRLVVYSNGASQSNGKAGASNQSNTRPEDIGTNQSPSLGEQGVSLGLDVTPVVGGVKGVAQVFTGEDLVTGEQLSRWEEAGYAVLGFFGLKGVAKAGDIADFGEASLKVLTQSDSLEGAAKGFSVPNDGVDVFRVVDDAELSDIRATGQFVVGDVDTQFLSNKELIRRLKLVPTASYHTHDRWLPVHDDHDLADDINRKVNGYISGRGQMLRFDYDSRTYQTYITGAGWE